MKYIFIVQGEGRGHMTQAITLEKMLERNGHEVVEILVGTSATRKIPEFFLRSVNAPVKEYTSVNFMASAKNRKPNMFKTVFYNIFTFIKYFPSIRFLRRTILHSGADVVVNFYELLLGLTYASYWIKIPQVSIGHQYAFIHRDFGLPVLQHPGYEWINFISRVGSKGTRKRLALSFSPMPEDKLWKIKVVPPLLRPEVLDLRNEDGTPGPMMKDGGYVLGYMLNTGFSDDVMTWHKDHPETQLHFFWDKWSAGTVKKVDDTLTFYLIDDKEFVKQMAGCGAYACTAGFESVCEAMYLGKPILMVPAHIEQQVNAFDAHRNGAGIPAKYFDISALLEFKKDFKPNEDFVSWVRSAERIILEELTTGMEKRKRRDKDK